MSLKYEPASKPLHIAGGGVGERGREADSRGAGGGAPQISGPASAGYEPSFYTLHPTPYTLHPTPFTHREIDRVVCIFFCVVIFIALGSRILILPPFKPGAICRGRARSDFKSFCRKHPSLPNLGAYGKNVWNRTSHGPGADAFANQPREGRPRGRGI